MRAGSWGVLQSPQQQQLVLLRGLLLATHCAGDSALSAVNQLACTFLITLPRPPDPLFFISKIPVSTPNEGVWDWVVVKLGLQLL